MHLIIWQYLLSIILQFSSSSYYDYPLIEAFDPKFFLERREKIINSLNTKSAIILFSADYIIPADSYDYIEPNSNLYYLTGITKQQSILLLSSTKVKTYKGRFNELIFLKEQSSRDKKWYGVRPDKEFAEKFLKIKAGFNLDDFNPIFKQIIMDIDTLYTIYPYRKTHFDITSNKLMSPFIIDSIKQWKQNIVIIESYPLLKKMREIKDSLELTLIQKAVDITVNAFLSTFPLIQTLEYEYELQATMEYHFRFAGAESPAYPSIIGSGPNSCVLHYSQNNRVFQDGELVLIDCGAKFRGYSADITRTIPFNSYFSENQKIIYSIVLEAQDSAIANCKAGNSFMAPHIKANEVISKKLLDLGIIDNLQDYRNYMPHSVSHYIGIDVHDVGTYTELKKGNIITIEPGIYIPAGSPCDKKWWNICIRIEDMILIADDAPVILSKKLPRTISELEKLLLINETR